MKRLHRILTSKHGDDYTIETLLFVFLIAALAFIL